MLQVTAALGRLRARGLGGLLPALASATFLGTPAPVLAQTTAPPPAQARRVEFGMVPLVGGSTDVGIGFGQLSKLAGLGPGYAPYRWAIESAAFISFKTEPTRGDALVVPNQDYYVQWTAPHLLNERLRVEARLSFTRETTQRFFGLGNASTAPAIDLPGRDFYGRTHPMVWARARYRLWDRLHAGAGSYYTQNWLSVPPQSTLAQQMATGDSLVRTLLGAATPHGVLLLEALALYDSRDSEIAPGSGQFHQIKLRVSPAIAGDVPYSYQQLNLTSRFFKTVIPARLGLAARIVADLQFGHPPFYELARYDDTYALGGSSGVRGVPAQRYYGKVKVFTNCEVRTPLFQFRILEKQLMLGTALFFDAGRAWTDLHSHPELDGRGWGIKYGVGGGLRLQEGKTFVVRADLAWSPDARPVGGYVDAGQMF
jgi:outer membrane protein assembly factor BamA